MNLFWKFQICFNTSTTNLQCFRNWSTILAWNKTWEKIVISLFKFLTYNKITGEKQRGGLVGFERFWAVCLIAVLTLVLIATILIFKNFHRTVQKPVPQNIWHFIILLCIVIYLLINKEIRLYAKGSINHLFPHEFIQYQKFCQWVNRVAWHVWPHLELDGFSVNCLMATQNHPQ